MSAGKTPINEKQNTVIISLNNISGKRLYGLVKVALMKRAATTGAKTSITDFCDAAGISRTQLYAYNKGEKPGVEGIVKIASGLKAWGNEVTLIF